jgi:predicted ATPase/DNA-binding SARP family transcriptional activator
VQVHGLRKRLGADRILTDGPGYRLRVEPGELDSARFEELLDRGRVELAADEAARAGATLRDALALWRGPPLADVAYEPFAQAEIGRLDESRLVALEERVAADLALARHAELVPELEALAGGHPLRERLQAQLMLALYRSGRQADALAVFRRARRSLRDELGLEPGPELRELHAAILRHDPALRLEPPELRARRHLPAPQTRLVGRRHELDEIEDLVRSGARLVTLTGPGGTGKTRLALQVAHDLADAFADGVYFVDLAPLRDPGLVASALAGALALDERGDEPVAATVVSHLRHRRVLLVTDNFEAVDDAAPLLAELLAGAPDVAVLATSRAPLHLSAEHEYRVPPLPLGEAVQLFATRAAAVAPKFRRASEEAEEVGEICRRLDCLPLAIELAAAQTRRYAPAEMLALLPGRLELAGTGWRDLPARQRTLRAAIDWSHDLLELDEQSLFARLSVFAGGCTDGAASAVCDAGRDDLRSLVAAALLQEQLGATGTVRFSMLETVREYALERLAATGEADAVRRRHATHFAAFAERVEGDAYGPTNTAWPLLEEEHDNLRAAVDWTRAAGAADLELRLAGALAVFWSIRGHLREGRERVAAALANAAGAPAPLRAKALGGAGWLAFRCGAYDDAERLADESLALYRRLGDDHGVALQLNRLGAAVSNGGEINRAIVLQRESADAYRRLGDDRGLAVTLSNLGYRLLIRGDHEQAAALCEEALALLRRLDERGSIPLPLVNLGLAALLEGRYDDALALFREGLELSEELAFVVLVIVSLDGLAAALAALGDAEEAATILGAVDAAEEETGATLEPYERALHDRTVATLRARLDPKAFAGAYEAGRVLPRDEAVAYALARVDSRPDAHPAPVA